MSVCYAALEYLCVLAKWRCSLVAGETPVEDAEAGAGDSDGRRLQFRERREVWDGAKHRTCLQLRADVHRRPQDQHLYAHGGTCVGVQVFAHTATIRRARANARRL